MKPIVKALVISYLIAQILLKGTLIHILNLPLCSCLYENNTLKILKSLS